MNAPLQPTPAAATSATASRPTNGPAAQPSLALPGMPPVAPAGGHSTFAPLVPIPNTAARLLDCLHELGYSSAVIQDARALLDCHGEDALRDVVRGAKRGEAGRLAKLGEWMLRQRVAPTPRALFVLPPDRLPTLGEPVHFVPVQDGSAQMQAFVDAQHRAEHPRPPAAANVQQTTPRPVFRDQVKVFGAKAALTLVADVTRGGTPTVTIEAAAALGGSERRYDWANKIRFQLTTIELQLVTALLLGHLPTLNFKNHGDKWLRATRQDPGSAFAGMTQIAVGQGSSGDAVTLTVAIDPSALGEVVALLIRQTASSLKLPVEAISTVLRTVAAARDAHATRNSHG